MRVGASVVMAGRAKATLESLIQRVAARVGPALRVGGDLVLGMSEPLVPVDTGALQLDGNVRQYGVGLTTVVYVGYGTRQRYALPKNRTVGGHTVHTTEEKDPHLYALKQHQSHSTHSNFLLTPFRNHVAIAAAVNSVLVG